MKTAIGFLVADRLHQQEIWARWFEGTGATALFHCHAGAWRGGRVAADQQVVPTERTTWQRTIKGHYALYAAFLRTDCTHLCLASESCIPIRPYAELRAALDRMPGKSLMNRLEVPAWFRQQPPTARPTGRKIYADMEPANCSHEQWCVLSREHVAALVANKAAILSNFAECYADNECFMGTALRHFGHGAGLVPWRTTHTEWHNRLPHPRLFAEVNAGVLAGVSAESFFFRKVNAATRIAIGDFPAAAPSAARALAAPPTGQPRLAVFVHLYYGELWEELLSYLDNVPEPFDLYVNLVGGQPGGEGYVRHLVQRIGFEVPFARVFVSPNQGRDVGGLFRLFAEVPQGRQYAAWAFLHGKRSVHASPGSRMDGEAWRKALLNSILGTPEQANRCLAELQKPNVGIVGASRWLEKITCSDYAERLRDAAGIQVPYPQASMIAGTMFWADGSLLEFWRSCGLRQEDFELNDPRIDGTMAHHWERMVSVHAKTAGLDTVGVPPAQPRLPAAGKGREFGTHFYRREPFVIEFDTEEWQFRERMRMILDMPNLRRTGIELPMLTREGDTKTPLHGRFYAAFASCFKDIYEAFVAEVLLPRFGLERAYVQAVPSFRAQLAGNIAVGEMHRDSDYGHDSRETNFWMPFTDTVESNCCHVEAVPGSGDFRPYPCRYGQILVFNGAYLRHGNVPNEAWDRTSIDFRMALPEFWEPSGADSVNGHAKFALGSYFEEMKARQPA